MDYIQTFSSWIIFFQAKLNTETLDIFFVKRVQKEKLIYIIFATETLQYSNLTFPIVYCHTISWLLREAWKTVLMNIAFNCKLDWYAYAIWHRRKLFAAAWLANLMIQLTSSNISAFGMKVLKGTWSQIYLDLPPYSKGGLRFQNFSKKGDSKFSHKKEGAGKIGSALKNRVSQTNAN